MESSCCPHRPRHHAQVPGDSTTSTKSRVSVDWRGHLASMVPDSKSLFYSPTRNLLVHLDFTLLLFASSCESFENRFCNSSQLLRKPANPVPRFLPFRPAQKPSTDFALPNEFSTSTPRRQKGERRKPGGTKLAVLPRLPPTPRSVSLSSFFFFLFCIQYKNIVSRCCVARSSGCISPLSFAHCSPP